MTRESAKQLVIEVLTEIEAKPYKRNEWIDIPRCSLFVSSFREKDYGSVKAILAKKDDGTTEIDVFEALHMIRAKEQFVYNGEYSLKQLECHSIEKDNSIHFSDFERVLISVTDVANEKPEIYIVITNKPSFIWQFLKDNYGIKPKRKQQKKE